MAARRALRAEHRRRARGRHERRAADRRECRGQGNDDRYDHGNRRQLHDQGRRKPDADLLLPRLHDRRAARRQTHGHQRQDDRGGHAARCRRDCQHRLRHHDAARPDRFGRQGRPGDDDEGQRHELRPGVERPHRGRRRHDGRRFARLRGHDHHPRQQLPHRATPRSTSSTDSPPKARSRRRSTPPTSSRSTC